MKRFVYLAGPIRDCKVGEANDWRKYVSDRFHKGIIGISPLRCEPLIGETYDAVYDDPRFGTPGAIATKNYFDTMNSDIVLSYMPKELNEKGISVGTIWEMGWADCAGKAVMFVSDDEYLRRHPIVSNRSGWILSTLDDAIETINGVLSDYVGPPQERIGR